MKNEKEEKKAKSIDLGTILMLKVKWKYVTLACCVLHMLAIFIFRSLMFGRASFSLFLAFVVCPLLGAPLAVRYFSLLICSYAAFSFHSHCVRVRTHTSGQRRGAHHSLLSLSFSRTLRHSSPVLSASAAKRVCILQRPKSNPKSRRTKRRSVRFRLIQPKR